MAQTIGIVHQVVLQASKRGSLLLIIMGKLPACETIFSTLVTQSHVAKKLMQSRYTPHRCNSNIFPAIGASTMCTLATRCHALVASVTDTDKLPGFDWSFLFILFFLDAGERLFTPLPPVPPLRRRRMQRWRTADGPRWSPSSARTQKSSCCPIKWFRRSNNDPRLRFRLFRTRSQKSIGHRRSHQWRYFPFSWLFSSIDCPPSN